MRCITLLLCMFILYFLSFAAETAFASETGFRSPTTCITNGSSCSNMKDQDTHYNSWSNAMYEEVIVSFTDFGVPHDAIIDDIQIKMRIRTSSSGWTWFVYASKNNGITYFSPINCTNFNNQCRYNTTINFNSINSSTMMWLNNNGNQIVTGEDINAPTFRLLLWQSSGTKNTDIDTVLFNIRYHQVTPAPTSTPVPTDPPTPIITPAPFLELPWGYEGKEMNFSDAALSINSYFDHTYPLLSSGLFESSTYLTNITSFDGTSYNQEERSYTSHDGYDYGTPAKVRLGDAVLSAAAGWAMYDNSCGACGHALHIDHENGYQTRYYHLQKDGLVVHTPGVRVYVNEREEIGKVGFSGKVNPAGENGAHIHFMVIEDKNHDGIFTDNIPDGVTDPFGWQADTPDPWEHYSFFYNGTEKSGNKSFYLWKKKLDGIKETITPDGGTFVSGYYTVTIPEELTDENVLLEMQAAPHIKISNTEVSIGSTMEILLKNPLGTLITVLKKPITLTIDFSHADLSRFDLGSLSIYSSNDRGKSWIKEQSIIDYINKSAQVEVDHLTLFALVAERLDTTSPLTKAELQGVEGQLHWFRSDVTLSLTAIDNTNGLGVDYTVYKKNDEDWQLYTTPLTFATEGKHTVTFYSVDKDSNSEEIKTIEFSIDKTAPEAILQFDMQSQDIVVKGQDNSDVVDSIEMTHTTDQILLKDKAGNTLLIQSTERNHGPNAVLLLSGLTYNTIPIQFDTHKISIKYTMNNSGIIKMFNQTFENKGDIKIALSYDPQTDKTSITSEKQKTEVEGIKILQLSTRNGTLNYSY